MALFLGVVAAGATLSTPADAGVVQGPKITPTQVTFTIPNPTGSTWTLRLWSQGALDGTANGTTGTLTVAVPAVNGCNFQADVTVLPVGGQRYFYSGSRAAVSGCGPPALIAGHIYLCDAGGNPTTTEVADGSLSTSGPETLPSQPNPLTFTKVTPGSYTMAATSPSNYVFVVCGGSATVDSSGTTATETVPVPSGGSGVGLFYVVAAAPTGSLSGGSGPGGTGGTTSGSGPPTSPGNSGTGTVADLTQKSKPASTPVGSGRLAFTGLDIIPLLLLGLLCLALGSLATARGRTRRRSSL
jgi:hypothetical protein